MCLLAPKSSRAYGRNDGGFPAGYLEAFLPLTPAVWSFQGFRGAGYTTLRRYQSGVLPCARERGLRVGRPMTRSMLSYLFSPEPTNAEERSGLEGL